MRVIPSRVACLLLIAASTAPTPALARQAEGPGLEIYYIDVLGGAATLVVTPDRESILIDSGWPGLDDRDPKRIEHVLKDVAGLDHLDHLVTTHWHTDHYGGVAGLAKRVRIDRYWDRGLPSDGIDGLDFPDGPKPDDPLLVAYLAASEGKRTVLRPGDMLPLEGEVSALVLASGGEVIGGDGAPNARCDDLPPDLPEDRSDNARSLALVFRLGRFDFLDCGDLTWNIERQLVCPVDRIGRGEARDDAVDLYQVTHHGLDVSNHPTLVQTIRPTVTIMNNGPRKGGSAEVVRLLGSIPSIEANYQMHRNVTTGPEDNTDPALIANDSPEGGQFIRVRVEPDGSRFSVQIGEDGPGRSFEVR
ncbi:ComEC/Rec2 family competence protein [Tautonia plasticadhaerens]|uniref:Metallo-beta-lactamase superfamily protein n=1 Tax=Tautonia plasticadhaerens TaxID=2527974 RepID=A0A518GZY7_9BACT|nr:MBL fold metallo-hydrolase [Tautonia plasticadhaerens]QDV34142.1 Metallo-beta-lactamase superfamily protein [Tautonia plasticadhaerens]